MAAADCEIVECLETKDMRKKFRNDLAAAEKAAEKAAAPTGPAAGDNWSDPDWHRGSGKGKGGRAKSGKGYGRYGGGGYGGYGGGGGGGGRYDRADNRERSPGRREYRERSRTPTEVDRRRRTD